MRVNSEEEENMRISKWLCFAVTVVCLCVLLGAEGYALELFGRRTVLVPSGGAADYVYMLSENGEAADGGFVRAVSLPAGVSFDESTCHLTVSSNAIVGETVILEYARSNEKPQSAYIKLTDNLVQNGNFADLPAMQGWNVEESSRVKLSEAEKEVCAVLSATTYDETENGYIAKLVSEGTVPMEAGKLYVLRADVRTNEGDDSYVTSPRNFGVSDGGTMEVLIEEIGDEWRNIYAAMTAEVSGVYNLNLNFLLPTEGEVYVKNIVILEEELVPSALELSMASSFYVPQKDATLTLPVTARVLDQTGTPMPNETVTVSLLDSDPGISYDAATGCVMVTATASVGAHMIKAVCDSTPALEKYFIFNTTVSGIYNGDFELEPAGEGWILMEPAQMQVGKKIGNRTAPDGSRFAQVAMNGSTAVLYNNSYVSFRAEQSYVFRLSGAKHFVDVETPVAIFVESLSATDFDESLIAAYFTLEKQWQDYCAVFTFDRDVTGRLLLAVMTPEEHDQQVVYLDNLSVERAELRVRNVKVSGTPRVGSTLKASYEFVNNYDSPDASMVQWLIADEKDGEYTPLAVFGSLELFLDESLEGKYLSLCVTPISATAGVFGEPYITEPSLILSKKKPSSLGTGSKPTPEPEEKPLFAPVVLTAYQNNHFADMGSHWAVLYVNRLADRGVIHGYPDGSFKPSLYVTRAEFAAMATRALGMQDGAYSASFADVAPDAWYTGSVEAAAGLSLMQARKNRNFMPDAPITRGEIIYFLGKALCLSGKELPQGDSGEEKELSLDEYEEILKACGILLGYEDGSMREENHATRAESAAMLTRLLTWWQEK